MYVKYANVGLLMYALQRPLLPKYLPRPGYLQGDTVENDRELGHIVLREAHQGSYVYTLFQSEHSRHYFKP